MTDLIIAVTGLAVVISLVTIAAVLRQIRDELLAVRAADGASRRVTERARG